VIDSGSLAIEAWSIDRLVPFARNARTHSDVQVAEIAGSIRAFGFANPILVGEAGDVVAGHGRLAAARKLGMAEVPVIVLRGLSAGSLCWLTTGLPLTPAGTQRCSGSSCRT
jgi:hypothetical protein